MRNLQIVLFILGILSFVVAAVVAGSMLGDILWRVGVGALLVDLVMMKLWPTEAAA